MIKLLLVLSLSTLLFAKYTNCEFQNNHYEDICKKVVKKGVSYDYANEFLLSYFKTKKYDEVSFKYLQPRYVKSHRHSEMKANKALVRHIPKMVEHLKKYKEVYDHSEKKFGVNREIVASILMKETRLGKITPKHNAFLVFNTLVVRTKPNSKREKWLLSMGKTNMISIITHCYKKGLSVDNCNLPSSYAGAVGIPQFMPNSFVYAEGYKTKHPDLTKMEDAIVSASKFLHKKAKFTTLIDWSKIPDMEKIETEWYDYALKYDNCSLVYDKNKKSGKVYMCFTSGRSDLEYLREYAKKIMRYNNSSNYAIGVMRLAHDSNKLLNSTSNTTDMK